MSSVRENIKTFREKIPSNVTVVAVSKTKPSADILEAYIAGHRDFGENYVQELCDKQKELPPDIRWHFIGHLQTNKVKNIASFVHLIHGVDSLRLLKEINKEGQKRDRMIHCLLQLHVASESTKFGLSLAECAALLTDPSLREMNYVKIAGFMAMASNTDDEETIRSEFRMVKEFAASMKSHFSDQMVLSYGMSSDYHIAIEEGSNMVRIGSAIFGERTFTPPNL